MENVRRVGLIAAAAVLLACLPGRTQAQQVGFAVDGFGGIAVPASNVRDFQSFGPSFGLGVEYLITDRLFVRGSGAADLLSGRDSTELDGPPGGLNAPDMTLVHYTAGLGLHLTPPDETNWDVSVSLEAGATSVSTDDFPDAATPPGQFVEEGETPTDEADFSETYVALSPGLRVGYVFNERYHVFFRSQPHFAFAESERTAAFAQFDDAIPDNGFEDIWNVPVTAGIQVKF